MELIKNEKTGVNQATLTVKVTAEEFGRAVDAAIRIKGKKLAVPGFRKGKAPKAILERNYGRSYFYNDAINETYGTAYDMAVEKSGIIPVDRADIALVDCSEDGYTFTATVTTRPEIEVKKYKGIKVEKLNSEVTDSMIEYELNTMIERNARIIEVEDRPAQMGDQAEIDYEGFKDGIPFEGGKAEKYSLELGSGTFIPGFEDQVCGHNIGDEFDVELSFPEDYPADELKGAPVVFKCKLHSIKAKELPVADDEFAKDVSEFDTLDELKNDIRERLQKKAEETVDADMEEQIADAVIENTKGDIPECMYEARIDDMVSDFEYRLKKSGLTLDEYLKYTGSDMAKFMDGFRPKAERQVKIRLALEEVAKLENIVVSKEELDEEYKKLAEQYDMDEKQVRMAAPELSITEDLAVEKAMKWIKENAKVTEKSAAEIDKEEKKAKRSAKKEETEEAPKKKATSKKKVTEETTEEAPKKKTASKKKAAEENNEDAVEAAPVKKTATRKKKSDDGIDPAID